MADDREIDELRARVEALEGLVARLQQAVTHPVAPASSPVAAGPVGSPAAAAGQAPTQAPGMPGAQPGLQSQPPPAWQSGAQPGAQSHEEGDMTPGGTMRAPVVDGAAPSPAPSAGPTISSTVLVAGAGAVMFLVGAVYFLTWSIEQGILTPFARVVMGVVTGCAMGLGSARLVLRGSAKLGSMLLIAAIGTVMFALYYGSIEHDFLPPSAALGGVAFLTLLAGGLSAHQRDGFILTIAHVSGLLAPIVFSTDSGNTLLLAGFVLFLLVSAGVVFYVTQTGGNWLLPRTVGLLGTWALLFPLAIDYVRDQEGWVLPILGVAYLLSAAWVWLPRHGERPGGANALWILASVAAISALCAFWAESNREWQSMAPLALGMAAAQGGLVRPLRRRLGDDGADLPLFALGAGFVLLGVGLWVEERWVSLTWSIFAFVLSFALRRSDLGGTPQPRSVRVTTWIVALAATLAWAITLASRPSSDTAFANPAFWSGVLGVATWIFLARGSTAVLAFLNLQVVFHTVAAAEIAWFVDALDTASNAPSIAVTLFFAISGAGQWLAGLRHTSQGHRRALGIAGYVWLGIGSAKLLLFDLESSPTVIRAAAGLGVGAIFMAAAVIGNRIRGGETDPKGD